jgi:hypothetical protein
VLNITYAADREAIFKVGVVMQRKWDYLCQHRFELDKPKSNKNVGLMQAWAEEAEKRYLEAGFKVTIDITPALGGASPPTITIDDRVTPELTDHERIGYEVKKEKA